MAPLTRAYLSRCDIRAIKGILGAYIPTPKWACLQLKNASAPKIRNLPPKYCAQRSGEKLKEIRFDKRINEASIANSKKFPGLLGGQQPKSLILVQVTRDILTKGASWSAWCAPVDRFRLTCFFRLLRVNLCWHFGEAVIENMPWNWDWSEYCKAQSCLNK